MATWSDLVDYVRRNYKTADEEPGMIKMVFEVGDLRSQVVFLWHQTLFDGQEEWVQIESPFGELDRVDATAALAAMSRMVCGGLASMGTLATVRHSVPLMNMDINEFERPLQLVISTADSFEKVLTGGDTF